MRAHYLRDVRFEGLVSIEPWLKARRLKITSVCFPESSRLPARNEVDPLIVMGGPVSAGEDDKLARLIDEEAFIRKCIQQGKRVLGICLGGQLIASRIGAKVQRSHVKKIGSCPVQGVPANNGWILLLPAASTKCHWHGETFDLPPGTVRIARGECCENPALQLDRSTIGLQFHLEMTLEPVQEILLYRRAQLLPSNMCKAKQSLLGYRRKSTEK
ncbi:MAG: type 1 glutamine amidotransferase [Acidobacteriota bacterium]